MGRRKDSVGVRNGAKRDLLSDEVGREVEVEVRSLKASFQKIVDTLLSVGKNPFTGPLKKPKSKG